jgi:hypothetical protein
MSFILLLGQKSKRVPSASAADPRRGTGLLFAYNLDETDDGTRYSYYGHGPDLSTVVNNPDDVAGIIGQALQGDGTKYVKSTDSSISTLLDDLQTFTVQFWYKRTIESDWSFNTFLNFGYQEPSMRFTMPSGSSGGPYSGYTDLRFYIDGTTVYRAYEYASASPRVLDWFDGEWHHVVYTFDGTEASAGDRMKMYYDGVDLASTAVNVTTAPSMTSLTTVLDEMEIGSGPDGG